MCRLYGFLATEPTGLECSLVQAQNSLIVQSDRDRRGHRNPDGWGIAEWHSTLPYLTRNTHPAFADRRYVDVASTVRSHAVIAHVRAATVGKVAMENTHPFDHGPWAFAHNGTIPNIEYVRTRLNLGLFAPAWGDTDSELAFRWILNRMSDFGLDPERPADDLEPIVDLIAESVTDLLRVAIATEVEESPELNFVISDGRHLVASRWGNSLYWTFRRGVNDCASCGTSHCDQADATYKAVAVASEPLTDEDWLEIPEGTVFGANASLETLSRSLAGDGPITVELGRTRR